MAQDKILHHLIHINRIINNNEHPKYAVPLFFNAAKIVQSNLQQMQARTYKKLRNTFFDFTNRYGKLTKQLDQVHIFMYEQATRIIQSQLFSSKSQTKSKLCMSEDKVVQEQEHTIVLQQQIYYFNQKQSTTEKDIHFLAKSNSSRPMALDSVLNQIRDNGQIDKIWQRIEVYYKDHRLDQAYLQYTNFKKECLLKNPNCPIPAERQTFLKKIEEQYNQMTYYYHFFEEPGYIFDKQDKGISMFYKIYQESNQISVRVQAQLDISIEVFLCIVSEIDLFQKYIPFSYQTKQLKRPTRNQKIGTTKVYLPLLSDRQAFFVATAYDRLKTHNSIFFFSKTISSDYKFQKQYDFKVNKNPDYIELQYKFYILEYRPIKRNRGKIRLSTNIDLKLNFLPTFVINKTCRIFAFDYFKHLIKVSKKFEGSQWQAKMNQNKDVYNFFKERIRIFIGQ